MLSKTESLVVERCNKLKRLFSTAIVQMLLKLKRIHISEAAQLEEIFKLESKNESASGEEIVLPNLGIIYLGKLPSFTEVCRGLKLNAVKLWRVEIDQCPKLYSILGATQEIPLQGNTEEQWPHVMNDTDTPLCNEALFPATSNVQVLNIKNCGVVTIINLQGVDLIGDQQEILNSDLSELKLENLPELRFIGTSTSRILNLKNLWSVKLSQCEKLKSVFTTAMIRSLPELRSLMICECEEFEEIIEAIEEPQNPSDAQVFFPQLREIEAKWCNKLKCLFSVTFAKMLPELNSLCVSEAAQLREVFEHRSEEGTTSSAEGIMLPSLETIELIKLPLLIDVCKGFKLQANQVIINDCPNFHSVIETRNSEGNASSSTENTNDGEDE